MHKNFPCYKRGCHKSSVFYLARADVREKWSTVLIISLPLEIRGQDMGDVMVLVDSEEEEEVEEENAAEEEEEEEEEANEGEESPEEIPKHGHIHRVTALVNGNVDWMANGLQALQGKLFFFQSTLLGCSGIPSEHLSMRCVSFLLCFV